MTTIKIIAASANLAASWPEEPVGKVRFAGRLCTAERTVGARALGDELPAMLTALLHCATHGSTRPVAASRVAQPTRTAER